MNGEIPSFTMEKRLVRDDGSLVWAYLTVSLQRDAGYPAYRIAIVQDISERKQLEELRTNEERFRGTFENAAVGIAHEDLTGRFLRFNERFCAILGYTPQS